MSELPAKSQIPRPRTRDALQPGVYSVKPGDTVRIRDAAGDWYDAVADSCVEAGDKFPIVWVNSVGKDGRTMHRLPWPIDAVMVGKISERTP